MKTSIAAICIAAALLLPVRADKQPSSGQTDVENRIRQIRDGLKYDEGEISILDGKAKIKLTEDFRFLDPVNARKVIVDIWGNPPEVGSVTGMVVPKGFLQTERWGAVLNWSDVGYVKDSEYDGIDFNKMLEKQKEDSREASSRRQSAGYGQMLLTGWATPPHYDKQAHKLYWAKAFDVDRPVQGLNYDIRILGRNGVIELSMVSDMSELAQIEAQVPAILGMVDFTDGNRYADYKSGDKVAAYGIAGLIAGGVLAKAGFFKLAWVFVAKFIKLIIVGMIALFAGIKRLVTGNKKTA